MYITSVGLHNYYHYVHVYIFYIYTIIIAYTYVCILRLKSVVVKMVGTALLKELLHQLIHVF